jgi:hypothetical protein
MKRPLLIPLALFLLGATAGSGQAIVPPSFTPDAAPPATPAASAPAKELSDVWPRTIEADGTTYTIYQPQLDAWDGFLLDARAAVSTQADGAKDPTYGIIFLHAETTVDREERVVHFEKLEVTKTRFPSLPDPNAYRDRFQSFIPKYIQDMALDRLEASLAIVQAQSKPVDLKNEPPSIIFVTKPAMLVPVDGKPHWAPVGKDGLERVVNTRALLLRDSKGTHCLHLFDGYVTATSLNGPWTIATSMPAAVDQAKDSLVAAKQVDLLAGQPDPETQKPPTLAAQGAPEIRVVTVATELVVTEGEPKWTPIPETQLLYIENTTANVFKHLADQQTYLLISGRWFKGPGEAGPWVYVPGKSLPADFAQIPDTSPKENIKASVPGTRQSEEAMIANSIPATTKMDRKTAKLDPAPVYDGGEPKLVGIAGTSLLYAENTSTPVIRVDEKTWYACMNGVWFVANTAKGPWSMATSVPAVIYTIPASSPLYYVTHVRVYRYDPEYVWVGYTPGYYGTAICTDGTVVYGTGYLYAPYVTNTVYVAYPSTYGYSVNMAWTPWTGWAFGFAVGYAWGASWNYWACMPPAPYWGPYWGYCYGWGYNAMGGVTAWGPYGWAGTSGNIYSQHGPWSGVSRYQGGYNAWTGNRWASQYGRAYNSVTGTRAVGQRGAVANVYSGNYAYGSRGAAVNDGSAAWGSKATSGNIYTGNEVTARRGGVYNDATGDVTRYGSIHGENGGVARVGDDVYAGHDGNIYKKGNDGSWQPVNGGGSSIQNLPADSSRPGSSGSGTSDYARPAQNYGTGGSTNHGSSLDQDYSARQVGDQRAQSFQSSRGAFQGGGGGGGGRRR